MHSTEASLLEAVRLASARVAALARRVRVREDRIAEYASTLPLDAARAPELDPAHHYVGDVESMVAFVVTLDAINFGSGYFPTLRKRPGLSGYFTVATSLKEWYEREGPLTARRLRALTPEWCASTFGQDPDPATPAFELMRLFARALHDLGELLEKSFDNSFTALVTSAEGSAEALVRCLTAMPYYRDVSNYRGLSVPFYKRAQLTAADLALAVGDSPYGRFRDLDRLTIFVDNLVPHVLRVDGILAYDPNLERRIDAGELLVPGSEEEIELRAGAVHAVELLVAELRTQGKPVTAMGLDYLLWNRGQQPSYKAIPRHRTRTTAY